MRKASTLIFCAHSIAIILISHFVGGWVGTIVVTVTGAIIGAILSENFKVINLLM